MAKFAYTSMTERRKHKRFPSYIKAEVNGQAITILDVSLGGVGGTIELRSSSSDIPGPGKLATVVLEPDSSRPIHLTVEVVRVDYRLNLFGARIVEMGELEFEFMKRHFAGQPV